MRRSMRANLDDAYNDSTVINKFVYETISEI